MRAEDKEEEYTIALYRQILIYAFAYHDIHGEDGETDFVYILYIFCFSFDRLHTLGWRSVVCPLSTCDVPNGNCALSIFFFVCSFSGFVNSFSLFGDNKFR